MKHIFVIGVGLIGGSIALDLKRLNPEVTVYGMDNNPAHLAEAISLKIIDKKAEFADLKHADLVILSIPVDASVNTIIQILDVISDNTLVVDVGSTKLDICKVVSEHPKRRNFLAMHPIAGTEFSGPKAAIHGLFKNKTNIICEVEKTAFKLQEKALKLFESIGMRIRYMNPESHDKHIAYVSHLSHISSFMLGKTVMDKEDNEQTIYDMAGSGFESTVRLAKSSPEMWSSIFIENKKNIIESLEEYILNINNFKKLIESSDQENLNAEMKKINGIKGILKGIN